MFMTKSALFHVEQSGYTTFRIPALISTPGGTLLAFCSARRGGGGDWDHNDIVYRRSSDGGYTWEPTQLFASDAEGSVVDNPCPIAGADGTMHMVYARGYARVLYRCSEDEGQTWSEPIDITACIEALRGRYDWKVVAPGPGHGIELRNGRLLVPLWLCKPDPSIPGGEHRPSCVTTIYSDDGGHTWQAGDIVVDTCGRFLHPSETTAAQLPNGHVMLNIRSESAEHLRLVATSPDGATGWSRPAFDPQLYEPVCCGSLLSLCHQPTEEANGTLLFSNPDSRYDRTEINQVHFGPRENLAIKVSCDDGNTWPVERVIEPGIAGYSDLAESPYGAIHCLYEGGTTRPGRGPNQYICCATLDLEWLTTRESE